MSILSDTDIRKELDKNIVIYPLSEGSITPLGYDISIGVASLTDAPMNVIASGKIEILPKSSIFILTKEKIWLSSKIIGTLHAKGSLAAKGIFINSSTVDPNWRGQMTCRIFNLSAEPIEVDIESTFVTLVFHYVNTPTLLKPVSNPISVAKGTHFEKHIFSNVKEENIFTDKIKSAERPQFIDYIQHSFLNLRRKLIVLLYKNSVQTVLIILLVFDIVTIIGFPLGLFNYLKGLMNFAGEYSLQLFVAQIALLVALISAIRSGRK